MFDRVLRLKAQAVSGVLAVICVLTFGCQTASSAPSPATPAPSSAVSGTRLHGWTGLSKCTKPDLTAYQCGTLTVPLDRTAGPPSSSQALELSVLVAGNPHARRTLLQLTGGPGQPGPSLAPSILPALADVGKDFRIVMVDQRGTGDHPLSCPVLQEEIGFSDLEVPTDGAITGCAARLGIDRAQYSTTATVGDLEDLRRALGVKRWSVDGVSYGTYVAQRYAAAHKDHLDRLVLDSVVPVDGFDPTMVDVYPEVATVLRSVCVKEGCDGDPANDLAAVVRRSPDLGPALLDVISLMSVVNPTFQPLPAALRTAAAGDEGQLRNLLGGWQEGSAGPVDQLSQGLHASTICLDQDFPWGGAQTPVPIRARAADRAVAHLTPAQLWPFNAHTARDNGFMKTCQLWPRTPDRPVPPSRLSLRGVNALLLHGDRDLSTTLAWARRAQHDIPGSRLEIIPDTGHSVQTSSQVARDAVTGFLRGARH